SIPKVARQTGEDIVQAGVQMPAGWYMTGKAGVQDIADITHGKFGLEHSRKIALGTLQGMYDDIRHPLRHPGYTALTVGGTFIGGGGRAVGRVGRGGAALRSGEGGRAPRAARFPKRTG